MSAGKVRQKVAAHNSRMAPIIFILGGSQYFLVQFIVGLRYTPAYSLANNTISDLGKTACAIYHGRIVCSPLHSLMNISFGVLGLAIIIGSMLFCSQIKMSRSSRVGFGLFAIGGFGVLLVGLFPENVAPLLHGIGATLPFLLGNVGLVTIGYNLNAHKSLRNLTLLLGALALAALILYTSGCYIRLGKGGAERFVAYPQTVWMILFGTYILVTGKKSKYARNLCQSNHLHEH